MDPLRAGWTTSEGLLSIAAFLAPIVYNVIVVPLMKKIGMDPTSPDQATEAIKQGIMWGANAVIAASYTHGRSSVKSAALQPEATTAPVIPDNN